MRIINFSEARNRLKSILWSRCIDEANRLIYAIDGNRLTIISCRYHYGR